MDDEDALIAMVAILMLCLAHLGNEQHRAALLAQLSTLIRDRIRKIDHFLERIVPQMLPIAFRRYFRMFPASVNKLIEFVLQCPRMHRKRKNRLSIPLWKKVYMTLAYMGSMSTTHRLATLFGISEGAFLSATDDVMLSLIDNISTFIRWPRKEHYHHIASNFDKMGRYFPNVIGCLDGCHLEFEVGAKERRAYRNYKGYYSINLMAIVTYNMSFLDIFVGWPGRSHDSRVFRESAIASRLQWLMHIPRQLSAETYSILADKAFPLVEQIMTPIRGHPTNLTAGERKFNRHLNSKRQTVERTFALLKRRFRRLKFLNQRSHDHAVTVVMAACILHNFCIGEDDNIDHYMTAITTNPLVDMMNAPPMPLVTEYNKRQGQLKQYILTEMIRRH